jgi:iron(III) transport system ATP-binding protein
MTVLTARGVSRRYGDTLAVNGVDLALGAGRLTCLLGPSGCGKSTLLRLLAGLEPLDAGQIIAGDQVLSGPGAHRPPEQRDVGFVFQDYALFPHLRVLDNVAFGLRRLPRAERRARALAELERVRLAHRADAWPSALSGGEQQRIALARALARDPAVILLDEPFSGLDGALKAEVRESALAALRAAGAAVVIVTHDAEEALMMADDLALMQGGRILQTGDPRDCYLRPVSLAAARLLGEANALPLADGSQTPFGPVAAGGSGEVLMARPEALRLDPAGAPAQVLAVRYAGADLRVVLIAGGTEAVARLPAGAGLAPGQTVTVSLDAEACWRVAD